jgi:methionine-rich copper-binding protein CopC
MTSGGLLLLACTLWADLATGPGYAAHPRRAAIPARNGQRPDTGRHRPQRDRHRGGHRHERTQINNQENTMRHTIQAAFIVICATAAASPAFAHAHLRSATPAVDSTVQAPPTEVAITFSEGVEPKFSTIEVQDAAGKRVDKNDPHTAPSDNKILSVDLPALQPGTYKVVWHATAVDTHKTEGTFSFTIKP